jgi:hypothetical protein
MYQPVGLTDDQEAVLAKAGADPIELHQARLREREVKAHEIGAWAEVARVAGFVVLPLVAVIWFPRFAKRIAGIK